MNKNSNTYIIAYSAVMVVVVAVGLAVAALSLKPAQDANIRIEKMSAILSSVGIASDATNAEALYVQHITESFLVDDQGNRIEGDAFAKLDALGEEYAKAAGERQLPVFVNMGADSSMRYIFPVWGTGLWGPIWGYVALEQDLDTIYGISLDHQGETPGLGAEIATQAFTGQYAGKMLFRDSVFVSVGVLKGTGASAGNPHAVDAISGGTITSRGVEAMLKACLSDYLPFITLNSQLSTLNSDEQDLEITDLAVQ